MGMRDSPWVGSREMAFLDDHDDISGGLMAALR